MIRLDYTDGRLVLGFQKLSDEQAAALVSDREVAVSAGAGAGKTSTLAARYVTLLQRLVTDRLADGGVPDIGSVLVLTFTEKAAQEMRERCYATTAAVARALRTDADRLRAAGLGERAHARLRSGWEALRDRFSAAAISTFHGFCARVLREFPAETGTPPGFTILEEADAIALAEASATEEVERRLAGEHPAIGLLLHTFSGRSGLIDVVTSLVRARGEVGSTLADHRDGRVTEATVIARSPIPPDAVRAFLVEAWLPWAERVLALTTGIVTPFLEGLAATRAALTPLSDDPLALFAAYARALQALRSSGGTLRSLTHASAMGKKAEWGARYAAAKAALEGLGEEMAEWAPRLDHLPRLPNVHDRTLLDVLAALGDLVLAACDRHGQGLRAERAVDFTELQLRVRAAFAAPDGAIAAELRRRHRFIMVDEFQDTDGLQWSIVEALSRPDGPGDDRLFFVGDVKQAIYGFRGGDVQVFNAARASVRHAVELSTNYRSRAPLIAFFNALFAEVLGPDVPDRPAWEASFSALAPGRKDPGGSVTVATYEGRGTDAEREAAWLARHLQEEVLAERGVYAGLGLGALDRHPTPPVAILLRRRRHLLTYEAALRARGIPYVVVGGVGFWGRPEVVDIGNVLHALARRDPISLVGALRSPLFGLTDQDLVDLGQARALHTFGAAPLPDALAGNDRVRRAESAWRSLARLRDHVSVGELVHAIITRTRQAWLQGLSAPGGRGAANLERLLAMADRHELTGGTLDAFAARILDRIASDSADAEAAVPDTAARVAILTVHASKGLEYPVVYLPDLGARWSVGTDASGVLKRRVGDRWELACAVPDRDAELDQLAKPGLLGLLRAHGAAVEAAEARRLFYVACTRARDHLVLVGSRRANPPEMERAGSWGDLLQAHVAGLASPPAWMRVLDLDAEPAADAPSPPPGRALPPPPADLLRRLAPLETPPWIQVSPSSLELFEEDPDAWYLRHVLRIPRIGVRTDGAGAEDLLLAGVRGDVLHSLLEDNLLDDAGVARARWDARAHEKGLPEARIVQGWETVRAQLQVLRESPDVAAILAASGYPELAVRLVRGAVTMDGRIDRLCRDPQDGAWMVVDYKSSRMPTTPTGEPDDGAALAGWRLQLLAYSVAASRVLEAHGDERVRRAAVLFTRTGRLVRLPDWTDADFAGLDRTLAAVARRLHQEGLADAGD